ncbi:MAG: ribosome maturation factor RimP [Acaryochloridaceae cyanobacterium SU_2_1]|nr:ribosome maturation factor RimP [Acaryochloridaceae cyanobacterium SU_2_1]
MTHPLIPQVVDLATPIATQLNLEVVGAVFETDQTPPVLRLDIRNREADTSLADCETMSRALEALLDAEDTIGQPYVLEISSPGLPEILSCDRDFISFRGFPVLITTHNPEGDNQTWIGTLAGRDEQFVHISQKGRPRTIPRAIIQQVRLDNSPTAT